MPLFPALAPRAQRLYGRAGAAPDTLTVTAARTSGLSRARRIDGGKEVIKSVAPGASWATTTILNMTRKRSFPPPPSAQPQRPCPPPPPPRPQSANMASLISKAVAAADALRPGTRAGGTALSPPQRAAVERARRTLDAVAAADRGGSEGGGRGGSGVGRKGNKGDAAYAEMVTDKEAMPARGGAAAENGRGRGATAASGWLPTTGATGGGGGGSGCDARALHVGDSMAAALLAQPTHQLGSRAPPQATSWALMPLSTGGRLMAATGAHDGQPGWPAHHNYEVPPPPRRPHTDAPINSGSGSNSGGHSLYDTLNGRMSGMNFAALPLLGRPPPPPPVSQSLRLAEAVKEAARAEYKRKSREDAAAAEAAAAAAAAAVRKRRRTGVDGSTGSDDEPPTPPPPPGDTEKYRRRLRMNQASAAAARHAQEVYVRRLEELLTAQQAEKVRIAEDASAVAATRARLEERLSTAQQGLRDATPATVPLPPLSRAPTWEATRGRWVGAPAPPQSTAHRHRHRGPRRDRPRPLAAAVSASEGGDGSRGRTDPHLGFGGSVYATYGGDSGGLPPLSAAAAAVASLGESAPSCPGWAAIGAGASGDAGGGGGDGGDDGNGGGGYSGYSSFQTLTPPVPTANGAAGPPLLPLAAQAPLPAESEVGHDGALTTAESSHLGHLLDGRGAGRAEEEMLALESLLGRTLGPGGVALV